MSIIHVLCMTGNLSIVSKIELDACPREMAVVKLLQEQFPANSWQFCCVSVALLGKVLGSHTVSSNSEICTCMAASFRSFLDVFDVMAAKF